MHLRPPFFFLCGDNDALGQLTSCWWLVQIIFTTCTAPGSTPACTLPHKTNTCALNFLGIGDVARAFMLWRVTSWIEVLSSLPPVLVVPHFSCKDKQTSPTRISGDSNSLQMCTMEAQ